MTRRKLATHLVTTNYKGIKDKIKAFKKRRATKANNK